MLARLRMTAVRHFRSCLRLAVQPWAVDLTAAMDDDAIRVPTPKLASPANRGVRSDSEHVVIQPRRGWQAIDFRELARHRELLYFLTWRDVRVRYKQTVLGTTWAVLQPVISMIIFSIVFGNFAKIPSDGVPYPIFVYAGLLPWTFFANSVSRSAVSLVSSSNLITRVYFPRLLVPTASVAAALVDFAPSFLVYAVMMAWYRYVPGVLVLLIPLLVVLTILTALGIGYLLTSVSVAYRDFKIVVPFLLQIWMYASPVVYPATLFPEKYRWVLALNPLTGIIGAFRSALLDKPMDWSSLSISTVVTAILFVFGLYNFRRTERRFADIM